MTARQIAHAEGCGFTGIRIDVNRAVDATGWEAEIGRITALALAALGTGASPLVYTARGPEDEAIAGLADACRSAGVGTSEVNDRIGAGLGSVLGQILDRGRLRRAVIAGGDTSGHATLGLGIDALSAAAVLAPARRSAAPMRRLRIVRGWSLP